MSPGVQPRRWACTTPGTGPPRPVHRHGEREGRNPPAGSGAPPWPPMAPSSRSLSAMGAGVQYRRVTPPGRLVPSPPWSPCGGRRRSSPSATWTRPLPSTTAWASPPSPTRAAATASPRGTGPRSTSAPRRGRGAGRAAQRLSVRGRRRRPGPGVAGGRGGGGPAREDPVGDARGQGRRPRRQRPSLRFAAAAPPHLTPSGAGRTVLPRHGGAVSCARPSSSSRSPARWRR